MEETDEAVPHATELSASSTELICSFDFYKLLFRSSPPFSINIKASYNYQKTFIIVVMSHITIWGAIYVKWFR